MEEKKYDFIKVLGDIFGIAITDKMRIKGKSYIIKEASVIVAIIIENKGKKKDNYQRLERHLIKYFIDTSSKSIKKIRIVSCQADDLVRKIERLIRLEVGKSSKN